MLELESPPVRVVRIRTTFTFAVISTRLTTVVAIVQIEAHAYKPAWLAQLTTRLPSELQNEFVARCDLRILVFDDLAYLVLKLNHPLLADTVLSNSHADQRRVDEHELSNLTESLTECESAWRSTGIDGEVFCVGEEDRVHIERALDQRSPPVLVVALALQGRRLPLALRQQPVVSLLDVQCVDDREQAVVLEVGVECNAVEFVGDEA